jgi:hypothetical protein
LNSFTFAVEIPKVYNIKSIDYWITHDLFTLHWWFYLILLIVPWVIFFKILNRKRVLEIMLFGVLISIFSLSMDVIGTILNFWRYRFNFLPIVPWLSSVNFSVLPVFYMIIYQYFNSWTNFTLINIITATTFSFIAQPLVNSLGFVEPLTWKYVYSFPILFLMPLSLKLLLGKLIKMY